MANVTQQDRNELCRIITGYQEFGAYPKRIRIQTNTDSTGYLQTILKKYWGSLIKKMETGGTAKNKYVRTYHNTKDDRNKVLQELQAITNAGYIEQTTTPNVVQDQNGNLFLSDGTPLGKTVTMGDQIQSLFSEISNTTIIIGGLIIIGIIFFVTRRNK